MNTAGMAYTDQIRDLKDTGLFMTILYTGSWYTQAKTLRKKDVFNYDKALVDSIMDAFRTIEPTLDDSLFLGVQIYKIDDKEIEQTEVKIEIMEQVISRLN